MFEKIRSEKAIREFHLIENYIDELNNKQYKGKDIQDFIPNIKIKEKIVKLNKTQITYDIYTLLLDNITYEYYHCREGSIFDKTYIMVNDILIYSYSGVCFDGDWIHNTPKEMLEQIIKHGKILKQYNKQLKEYFKYNSDYAIEQRKLNDIFVNKNK